MSLEKRRITILMFIVALFISQLFSIKLHAATLLDIYDQAVSNDPELAIASESYAASREIKVQARAGLLPSVSAGATASFERRTISGLSGSDRFSSHNYGVALSQPLVRVDRWHEWQSAKSFDHQAKVEYELEQQLQLVRVAQAYFSVLRAKDNLALQHAEEQAFKKQRHQVLQRYKAGLVAKTDVYEARAAYDLAVVKRISANNELKKSLQAIMTLTHQQYDQMAELNEKMPVINPNPVDKNSWIKLAIDNNLNLAAIAYSVDVAKKTLQQQKAKHLPSLDLVARYDHSNSGAISVGNEIDSQSIALELTIPIFQGGSVSSKVRETYHRLLESQHTHELQKRQIIQSVADLYESVITDVWQVSAQQQVIQSSDSALKATIAGYKAGTRHLVDVLNAQQVLFAAKRDYANARYDYVIHNLQLKQAAGILSKQDLVQLNQWLVADSLSDS